MKSPAIVTKVAVRNIALDIEQPLSAVGFGQREIRAGKNTVELMAR